MSILSLPGEGNEIQILVDLDKKWKVIIWSEVPDSVSMDKLQSIWFQMADEVVRLRLMHGLVFLS